MESLKHKNFSDSDYFDIYVQFDNRFLAFYSISTGRSGSEVIKFFSISTQLSMKFILLINVKMPTIVGILTFMSRIND